MLTVCSVVFLYAIRMASLIAQLVSPVETGHKVWQDQSFIKWRKRDPHVTLHCHESVEGKEREDDDF